MGKNEKGRRLENRKGGGTEGGREEEERKRRGRGEEEAKKSGERGKGERKEEIPEEDPINITYSIPGIGSSCLVFSCSTAAGGLDDLVFGVVHRGEMDVP